MARRHDDTWKYAPLWAAILGASHTMLKNVIVRYVRKRKLSLHWSDVVATTAVGLVGYLTLRHEHGREAEGG